jgi:hypothetical protein
MSSLLLPELTRVHADSNRRIARSVETVARQLQGAGESERALPTERRRATGSAQDAVRHTLAEAAEGRSLWQRTLALFQDGLEGAEAREVLQEALAFFDSWFALAKATRELCQAASQAGTAPDGLQDLDAASRDLEVLRTAAEDLRVFLNRPRPPIDPAVLEKARQGVAEGRYKDPETVRARLRERHG